MTVAKSWRQGCGELVFCKHRVQVWEDEKNSGDVWWDGYTAMWMPQNCTLENAVNGRFCYVHFTVLKNWKPWGSRGGPVVKNLQETGVQSPIQEDPTRCRATKCMHRSYWARALELGIRNYWATGHGYWSPSALEPSSAAREASTPQLESRPRSPQLGKSLHSLK